MSVAIRGRIAALARAHALIRVSEAKSTALRQSSLEDLVTAISEPYCNNTATTQNNRIVIDGPQVMLGNEAITALALVLHELATNALKYGAFSTALGQIYISWNVTDGALNMTWRETSGPKISGPPSVEGFGSLLARHSIEGQLHGKLAFEWDVKGLTVTLSVDVEQLEN